MTVDRCPGGDLSCPDAVLLFILILCVCVTLLTRLFLSFSPSLSSPHTEDSVILTSVGLQNEARDVGTKLLELYVKRTHTHIQQMF